MTALPHPAAQRVRLRIAALDRLLKSHAGGLELLGIDARGVVRVRFTGMCTGCELRPVTAATVVQPALQALAGVSEVQIAGGRVSDEVQAALRPALGTPCSDTQVQQAALLRALEAFERT